MSTTWIDFKHIKAEVAIEQVVARYGVHLRPIKVRRNAPTPPVEAT